VLLLVVLVLLVVRLVLLVLVLVLVLLVVLGPALCARTNACARAFPFGVAFVSVFELGRQTCYSNAMQFDVV
jgi:hypothetical protein